MYYYVVEAAPRSAQGRAQQRVRTLLADLGILGEFAIASPARGVEELALMGVEKGYTTIVAVGGGRTANKVASVIQGKGIAMGLIPTETNSVLHELIGSVDIKTACTALKGRKLTPKNLVLIEPNKYVLTQASIHFVKPYPVELELDNYQLNVAATDLVIFDSLYVRISNRKALPSPITRWAMALFGRRPPPNIDSVLPSEQIRVISPVNALVIVEHEIVAKTPTVFRLKRNALQLIVARGKK